MKELSRFLLPLLLCVAVASPALAGDSEEGHCKKVQATIIDVQVTDGCTSPNKFCAAGVVKGNHGLNGTTYFSTDSAVLGPPTRPGSIAASGILVFTLDRGTLTVRESGLSLGDFFSNFEEVLSGTDDFAGATGHMWVLGSKVGDHFESDITGVLCTQ